MEKTLKEILKALKSIDDRLRKMERSTKRSDRDEKGNRGGSYEYTRKS